MHTTTFLVHSGRQTARAAQAINPPLVRASTVVFDTLAAYKHAHHQTVFDSPRYGRSGTSTTFELQRCMAALSGAETCLATASGLAAIVAVLSAHAGPGRHLLLNQGVYGPTRIFCDQELVPQGTTVEYFPEGADIAPYLRDNTSLVYIETPASLTMEMLDVRAVCAAARQRHIPVAVDATWGTPVFFDAHALGVHIAIHSATKYINGHSDLMLGLITGSHADLASTRRFCDRSGAHAAPDVCWLALRGLRTLAVRLERHQQTALATAQWLQQQPQVRRVDPRDLGRQGHPVLQRREDHRREPQREHDERPRQRLGRVDPSDDEQRQCAHGKRKQCRAHHVAEVTRDLAVDSGLQRQHRAGNERKGE
mgnify:CR=1 FL=1